jgi:hypothetical protein
MIEHRALATADVEHSAHRNWILTDKAQDFGRVAQPTMGTIEVSKCPRDHVIRQLRILQEFSRRGALYGTELRDPFQTAVSAHSNLK